MKRMLIAGNWKMNTNINQAVQLADEIVKGLSINKQNLGVLICPPFTNLYAVYDRIKNSDILLGAQNCYYEPKGAFTGEVSLDMLKSVNCEYVIIGHSERRAYFKENDKLINKKAIAALNFGIKPIICIGEKIEQRQNEFTFDILRKQVHGCLNHIDNEKFKDIVIAYEPVWAIGTGIAATTEQIQEAHEFIRGLLIEMYGDLAKDTIIQYGGSVNENNSKEIFNLADVNGALVGGASLKSKTFLSIISSAQQI